MNDIYIVLWYVMKDIGYNIIGNNIVNILALNSYC